jgi:diaminobutyrate-2-oxoglutarate transaminase
LLYQEHTLPYSGVEPEVLQRHLSAWLNDEEVCDLATVIKKTKTHIADHSILIQHPHCIAHLQTPPLLSAISAEVFISTLNQSMDSWDQASAATFVEQLLIDWLCKKYQFGDHSDGVFTSGGTQSNLMSLLLARDWAVEAISQENVKLDGLPSYAARLRILCSDNAHFTVQKSAALLGLGERSVISIPCNKQGEMNVAALIKTVNELRNQGLYPFALVGTAGTTDMGAIDDLNALADVAQAHQLWFHVDAAYGGALMLSRYRDRLSGLERADSVTIDFHKLFYQPISCGAILLKNKEHFRYLQHHADYLNREDDPLPNLVDKSIVTSKRFDALKLWMSLKSVGEVTLGAMYDHVIEQTQAVAEMIVNSNEFELVRSPQLSTILFRYCHRSGEEQDRLNQDLRLTLLQSGKAILGETRIDKKVTLKLTLLNPCLTLSDFSALFVQIDQTAKILLNTRNV